MASTFIEVNTTINLKGDVSEMAGELKKVLSCADELDSTLRALDSMWEGTAKQAFSTAVQDDVKRLRELVKAMQNFTNQTDEARREYEKCENAVAQIVSSIRV